jgi:hypothetical protein
MVWPMSARLTQLIRSLALMMLIKNPGHHRTPQFYSNSGSTGQTGVAVAGLATGCPTGQTVQGHQSDWWHQPDRLYANFGCKHTSPLFFSKACCLKNNSKVDVTLHRPFFGLRAIFSLNRQYPIKRLAKHLDEISWSISRWEPLEVVVLAMFPPYKNS